MSESDDLWSLYGSIGNQRTVPLRQICQSRIEGIDKFVIQANLRRSAKQCREIAEKISHLGGSEAAVERCEKQAEVLTYWTERPGDLRSLVKQAYSNEYEGSDEYDSMHDVDTSDPCPYEKNPEGRMCWGCHVPRKVWEEMERQYDKERVTV